MTISILLGLKKKKKSQCCISGFMPGACSPFLKKKKKIIPNKTSDRVLFNETRTSHCDFPCNAKDKELHTVISEFYFFQSYYFKYCGIPTTAFRWKIKFLGTKKVLLSTYSLIILRLKSVHP